jgi:hypothetical protein
LGATAAALQRVLLAPADGNADLRTRHDRIRTLKRELAASLAERRDDLRRAIAGVRQQLAANRILNSREWAFCLYPESVLRPALTRFLA